MHLPVKRTPRVRHNEPKGYSASEPRGTVSYRTILHSNKKLWHEFD